MTVIFHDQMHKNMDAYVDDVLVKSKEGEDHLDALGQVFKRLILYKLRLNPQKCVFGDGVRQTTWLHDQQERHRSGSRQGKSDH